jgi:hypothetical protein
MRSSKIDTTGVLQCLRVIAVSLGAWFLLPSAAHAQEAQSFSPKVGIDWRARLDQSHWDLFFNLGGGVTEYAYAPSPAHLAAERLSFTTQAQLTRFIKPVVDDSAPRSLQPFLQRASTVSASFTVAGNGEAVTEPSAIAGGKRVVVENVSDVSFNPNVGFNIYALRWLAFTGGFGYGADRAIQPRETIHHFNPRIGIGARMAETRLDASYSYDGYDTVFPFGGGSHLQSGGWGTLSLDLETVIARRVALRLGGKAFVHGEGGSGSIEYYFTKNFGISAGGFGYAGIVDLDAKVIRNAYGLTLGADVWVLRRARLALDYELSGATAPQQIAPGIGFIAAGNSSLTNQLVASALFRLP